MIEYYLKIDNEKTEKIINDIIIYFLRMDQERNITHKEYYDIYDKIEGGDKEYYKIINYDIDLEKDNELIKECLKEAIKRIIDNKEYDEEIEEEISEYKEDYEYYPDYKEKDFEKKLSNKKEIGMNALLNEMNTIEDKCNVNFFELAPHQILLKNLLSKNTQYNGILIFHGVGVGKTCSGVSIAENFKDIYAKKENRTIILSSKNIQIGWKKTIYDSKKHSNQCTGDTYETYEKDEEESSKQGLKKIKKYYEMYGYGSFANKVKKLIETRTKNISKTDIKNRLLIEKQCIKEIYSNRVLIIDEAHNIRGEEGANSDDVRDTIKYISKVIEYSDNLKLILLTANPMFNISSEIVWILNMLLLNDKRKPITDKIFDDEGNLNEIGYDVIKNKSRGYISYLRGENPISFPIRLYPKHEGLIVDKNESPDYDIFMNKIKEEEKISFLELYSSELTGIQRIAYEREVQKYKGYQKLKIQGENKLLQMSNIIYPNGEYGEDGLVNSFNVTMRGNSPQYKYNEDIEFLDYDLIGEYSSKIKKILEIISKSKGIVFIYTNWIKAGIIPLVLALEQNGYLKYDGSEILKSKKKREPISYSPDKKDEYKPSKYMVIAGGQENLTHNLKSELEVLTSSKNKNGELIKVVIGSKVASEGLDFKCIRSIHILEPWHNINKLEQVIGRGIRNCSHTLLTPEERNVTIYLHNSYLNKDVETIDTYLYRYSEKKAKQIGEIENILKKNAIDKYLFQNVNFLSKKDVKSFTIKPSYITSEEFIYKPDDKPYSRVCSFQNICNPLEDDKYEINEDLFNEDTFQIKYSQGLIDIYKKRISLLFSDDICYSYDEIYEKLIEYKKIDEYILIQSLNQIITNRDIIRNNSNNGYLIYNKDLFIFQPYYNTDKLITNYYRINKGNNNFNYFSIVSNIERKSKIDNEIVSYDTSENGIIDNLYKYILNQRINKNELEIFKFMNISDDIKYQYIIDRLSFSEKKILLYSLLYSIKENKIINKKIFKYLLLSFESLLLYYNEETENYEYHYQYDEKNKFNLIGGFLYHHYNRQVYFLKYDSGKLSVFNKIDEMSIISSFKKIKKINFTTSWGYTTFSSRYKKNDNGIIMKIVKNDNNKKVSYPPGPGNICRDSNNNIGGTTSEETLLFIQKDKEMKEILSDCGKSDKKYFKSFLDHTIFKSKINYSIFIEISFRILNRSIKS